MRRDAADTPVKSRGQTTSNKLRTSCPMSRWGTAAHLGVNRTITALGIVARHAGLGLEPFVVRELPACRRTRDVSSCRGGPNGAADSQTAAKLAQGRVGPHARATQRSVGAGRRGTREKVLGSRLLYSPGQPRPSEKIGRASTRGVSKHKPGAFELILSWARRQASTAIGLPACSASDDPAISALWVVVVAVGLDRLSRVS